MTARDIMTTDIRVVSPDHSIGHAAQIMIESGVSGLPVIDGSGRLAGIITEGDLLRRVELGTASLPSLWTEARLGQPDFAKTHSWRVAGVMTNKVIYVDENATVPAMVKIMREWNIKRLPVVRAGELVGMISRRDLLRRLVAAAPEPLPQDDEAIRRGVHARLAEQAGLLATIPDVRVDHGVVHVSGTVHSPNDREVIRVILDNLAGIAGVVDELTLDRDA